MSKISMNRVRCADDRTSPAFLETDRVQQVLRGRAYELFANRGGCDGHALDDWLHAELESGLLPARVAEHGTHYVIEIPVPGCKPRDVQVTVTPRELVVHACAAVEGGQEAHGRRETVGNWNGCADGEVCRRIEFASDVDVGRVTPTLQRGTLTIIAPKANADRASLRGAVAQ